PGCTRQINVFEVRHADGWAVRLVDLPGFGFAKRSKEERASWGRIIEDYLRERSNLALVVLLVDARRGVEQEELMLGEFLRHVRGDTLPLQLVATKLDRIARSAVKPSLGRIAESVAGRVIGFSAKTGEGTEPLWRAIRTALPSAGGNVLPDAGLEPST
ncbi:MAG: GTP-binding protein, partial [Polyangiaceae bacterium]|nr:GTP-binding protein [Polyangiaceae bacterium]